MVLSWGVLEALRCLKALYSFWGNSLFKRCSTDTSVVLKSSLLTWEIIKREQHIWLTTGNYVTLSGSQGPGLLSLERGHSGHRQCFHPNRNKSRAQCTHLISAFYCDSGRAWWWQACSLSQFAQAFCCMRDSIRDCVGHCLSDFFYHFVPRLVGLL